MRHLPIWLLALAACSPALASPDPIPISEDSKKGLGMLGPGGRDDLSVTTLFLSEQAASVDRHPVLFPWGTGVIVSCATAGFICQVQGAAADYSIDVRGRITDTGGNNGFGLCRWVVQETAFTINQGYFAKGDAVGRRDGVCEDLNNIEFGRPCRQATDCRTGALFDTNDCDVAPGGHVRTTGAYLLGSQECSWSTEW